MEEDASSKVGEEMYVESLLWRRGDLERKLASVHERMQVLSGEESDLRQELRAVEQLLFAVAGNTRSTEESESPSSARPAEADVPSADSPTSADTTEKLEGYGPTARKIYMTAERVILEAGVPLHYRVLAEEVQKRTPLSGKDPGATLIAHLHRAQDLFPRVGRGVYGVRGLVDPTPPVTPTTNGQPASTNRRRTRRRRTR
jgi:hypothetical protein